MKTAHIIYEGELRTSSVHLQSGKTIITDAPTDNNGKGEAFSPTDLLATSLGCCMLTIMGIVAKRHELQIEQARVDITKIMASNPRRVSAIKVEFHMPPGTFTDKDRQLLENAAHTCPVALSLHPDIHQDVTFNWP